MSMIAKLAKLYETLSYYKTRSLFSHILLSLLQSSPQVCTKKGPQIAIRLHPQKRKKADQKQYNPLTRSFS